MKMKHDNFRGGLNMEVEIYENLKRAVIEYDSEGSVNWARKAVEEGIPPSKALDALTEGIQQVGDGYGRGELWLPDLIGAANAMTTAMPLLEEEIMKEGKQRRVLGTIVIGTVFGDIHSIGKTLVATLSTAAGFEVVDLGINVTAEKFMAAIREHNPNILAMSALLTTTASEQAKVIKQMKEEGLREKVKVVVGGGGLTRDFAEKIGADGYEPTAPMAVELFKKIVG
jgi:corrinoid protein of di/trimethylamine methyltransferase